ncbi:MAG: hypothetical protein EKK41_24565 [Hyphomicrobiales bacterium]|nr:MAG: hypothetical protein EKK41_24565 [Hyphomicrobiales bacterium]
MTKPHDAKEKKVDEAIKETFPASDPPAFGRSTGNEPANKPTSRQAAVISKEDIEAARQGEGHKKNQKS